MASLRRVCGLDENDMKMYSYGRSLSVNGFSNHDISSIVYL